MVMSILDSSGGVFTGAFAKWTIGEQKDTTFTMKHQHLFSEGEDKREGGGKGTTPSEPVAAT